MGLLNDRPIATAAAVLITAYLTRFLYRFIQWRKRLSKLPGPPHHPVFGHLISMGEVVTKLPKRVHPHVFPHYLTAKYNLPPVFYIDMYPLNDTVMIVLDPEAAQDMSAVTVLRKHPALRETLRPLAGQENMVVSDGAIWKKWRSVFNPAFSVQQLMAQVPLIVDCGERFTQILDRLAVNNELFRLEEEATKVTIDVIGKTVCDHDFNALLTDDNEFVKTMRKTLSWMPDTQSVNLFHKYNPLRPFFWKYYKNQMDKYVGRVLDERFSARDPSKQGKARKKTGIDLALEEYFKESGQDVDSRNASMDGEFRRYAIDNLLVLLFAGHDTTASTICYCYYLLWQNPEKLKRIRQELDDVFGADMNAAEQLKRNSYLINKCEYTLAVIRETLRLWPPASTVRQGRSDYFIKDPTTGNMLPTEGFMVWSPTISIHRDPRVWGETVHEFQPERFLPENADKLTPHAYRPFEKGPRNCIGQELALLEMKVILALTVREFDVKPAYGELDELGKDGSLWAADKSFRGGPQECFNDPAYQVLLAAGKPREGMPARVSRRSKK